MLITVAYNHLFYNTNLIPPDMGRKIVEANGQQYLEVFVQLYKNHELTLDDKLKIVATRKI